MGGVEVLDRPEPGFVCEWGEPDDQEAPAADEAERPAPIAGRPPTPAPDPGSREGVSVPPDDWMTGEPTF